MTTKYNVYFNGNEAYKKGVQAMEEAHNEDFSQQLDLHPVYKLRDLTEPAQNADFDRAIDKCKIALQRHSITRKPTRKGPSTPKNKLWLQRAEYNPYMHNVWLLSGKAQFYKGDFSTAAATFWYTARKFNWKPQVVNECHIWMARIYAVQGYRYDAETELGLAIPAKQYHSPEDLKFHSVFKKMNNDLRNAFCIAQAEIYLCQDDSLQAAIPWLQAGRKAFPTSEQRIRVDYLTAQLLEASGNRTAAEKLFKKVAGRAKDFRTQINARIAGTSSESKLNRMSWQARNVEYLDQIFCKSGDLALEYHRDTVNAIRYHELAIEKSTRNGLEKALAALHLGKLALATNDYLTAQRAYSIAMSIISPTYNDYDNISRLSKVLDELQTHAETVHMQDSLLALSELPEPELMAHIDNVIKELKRQQKEAEEQQRKQEYNENQQSIQSQQQQNMPQQPIVGNTDKSWYFYNKALVNAGKSQFQRLWGARKPEDDWRRINKTATILNDNTSTNSAQTDEDSPITDQQSPIQSDSTLISNQSSQIESDPLTREYHLAQIPFSAEQKATSNSLIEEGLYNMGVIINEKLDNQQLAINTFTQLIDRYPESQHVPDICFSIYLMYMRMGNTKQAEVWRQRLLQTYPETAVATALQDPNYIETQRHIIAMQDSLYRATYNDYLIGNTASVHQNFSFVKENWPLCELMPKFQFLDALSHVQDGNAELFKDQLESLTATWPESDVSPLASLMVKGYHEGRQLQLGHSLQSMKWDLSLRTTTDEGGNTIATDSSSLFIDDDNQPHVLILAFAKDSVDNNNLKFRNNLLFEVAKFNFENYLLKDFDTEFIEVGNMTFLVISSFDNLDELLDYHDRIDASQSFEIPAGVDQIDISEPNFQLLLSGRKTFQQYFDWVIETYGEE